ncbi:MAG: 3-hydroxyacyl-ACP dehydratase FabZ [Acidimicrobiales bacterium]
MTNTLPTPTDVIPHRDPFLFLDEVTELEPGVSAKGFWIPGEDLPFFAGHFPGRATLPGVLMAESIAQLGAYAVLHGGSFAGKIPLFGGLDKAKFRRQVLPGDRLDLELTVTRMSARAGKASGRALVNGEVACSCDLLFVGVDI